MALDPNTIIAFSRDYPGEAGPDGHQFTKVDLLAYLKSEGKRLQDLIQRDGQPTMTKVRTCHLHAIARTRGLVKDGALPVDDKPFDLDQKIHEIGDAEYAAVGGEPNEPMMPDMNSSGMNTATSETVSDTIVKPICLAPL